MMAWYVPIGWSLVQTNNARHRGMAFPLISLKMSQDPPTHPQPQMGSREVEVEWRWR